MIYDVEFMLREMGYDEDVGEVLHLNVAPWNKLRRDMESYNQLKTEPATREDTIVDC